MSIDLAELNECAPARAAELFASCCGARRWVAGMVAARPFASHDTLAAAAARLWWSLGTDDWLEAFTHHPRIGERKATAAATNRSASWSAGEQSRVAESGDDVRAELARANADYERRFGYTYIVRASGRTAEEMLSLARQRLGNDPETELRAAAEQQREIMQLRIEKLLNAEETT